MRLQKCPVRQMRYFPRGVENFAFSAHVAERVGRLEG
jgi:hypothetical protein